MSLARYSIHPYIYSPFVSYVHCCAMPSKTTRLRKVERRMQLCLSIVAWQRTTRGPHFNYIPFVGYWDLLV
uniref:Ovule protein n=1 Tax=Heterorhabditis bacteriophora TaxID=37862 RepID=A0A1I7WQ99_HETBA